MIAMETDMYFVTYNTMVTVLSAVITGGFVLILVELSNRRNREDNRHQQKMNTFMLKLSAYFRYLCWINAHIVAPKNKNEEEKSFLKLIRFDLGNYGSEIIERGGNYSCDDFSAKELEDICENINRIWRMYDKGWLERLSWEESVAVNHEFIEKELSVIDPRYISMPCGINQIIKVSGEFYTDVYQPIQEETYYHERIAELTHIHTTISAISLFLVLVCLGLLICVTWSVFLMKIVTIVIILLLGFNMSLLLMDEQRQLKMLYKLRQILRKAH